MGRGGSPSTKPPANRSPHGPEKLHQTEAGQNHAATFFRVAMLFRLRAVLTSLIDTMDQHFQDLLHPSTAHSAWRQFAHYYGYSLMALPAGLVSRRIGYRERPHFWADPRFARLRWVRAGRGHGAILGVPGGRMRRGDGPHGTGNRGRSRSRVPRIEGHAVFRINLAQSFNGFGRGTGPKSARSFSTPPRSAPRRPASLATFRICSSPCLWSC